MSGNVKTLELARLYERQGYYADALDAYLFLDEQGSTGEVHAGVKRMKQKMETADQDFLPDRKLFHLFEKWLKLIILKHRLDNFKKIKNRLS
jgi:hypothetical protein